MQLVSDIVDQTAEMARWRHDIHKHPDYGPHSMRTASKVAELMRTLSFDEVIENFGQSGVVGVLKNGEGPTVGLVAAFGGQRLQEQRTNLEYCSEVSNCMHALGHDGETAMLMGVARYLAANREDFSGTVVFILYSHFDSGLGAMSMVEDGLFQRFKMEQLYSFRSVPSLDIGQVAIVDGPEIAGAAELLIQVTGVAGHGAVPYAVKNPISAVGAMINSLGDLVMNEINPESPIFIEINSVQSGDSFIYVPNDAKLECMVRFMDAEAGKWLPTRLDTLVSSMAKSYDVETSSSYREVCPPGANDKTLAHVAREVATEMLGSENVFKSYKLNMLDNGFSLFQQEVPGIIISLGNGGESGVLTPEYNFNDAALPVGASLLVGLARKAL